LQIADERVSDADTGADRSRESGLIDTSLLEMPAGLLSGIEIPGVTSRVTTWPTTSGPIRKVITSPGALTCDMTKRESTLSHCRDEGCRVRQRSSADRAVQVAAVSAIVVAFEIHAAVRLQQPH
jgi:hypothetical protein